MSGTGWLRLMTVAMVVLLAALVVWQMADDSECRARGGETLYTLWRVPVCAKRLPPAAVTP
jgi:hypothetical protein